MAFYSSSVQMSRIENLGTGANGVFDIKTKYPKSYSKYEASDFIVECQSGGSASATVGYANGYGQQGASSNCSFSVTKTYDSTTGKLTVLAKTSLSLTGEFRHPHDGTDNPYGPDYVNNGSSGTVPINVWVKVK